MKHPLHIIGLYPGSLEPPAHAVELIHKAEILTGGKRLLEKFPEFEGRKIQFISPVADYARELKKQLRKGKRIVLLADGDPLFYGIAESLLPLLGRENISIIPSVSAIEFGGARLGFSRTNMATVSLHGRDDYFPLFAALQNRMDCAVYTDRKNTPSMIARRLLEKGVDNYTMCVLAELNTESEIIAEGSLESFTGFNCADLNIVILKAMSKNVSANIFGRDDNSFIRQKGLITKLPVRATGLALLDLQRDQTVWDLGAGCGSVAIEGSFIAGNSRFFAVEKDFERFNMIGNNIRKFKAWTVEAVSGTMPQALETLPDPDRIFIGGGIGKDDTVIREAAVRLKPGGRLVVHAILMGSIQRTRETLDSLGWQWQSIQLQSSCSEPLAGDVRFKAHNPVTIISADKPQE